MAGTLYSPVPFCLFTEQIFGTRLLKYTQKMYENLSCNFCGIYFSNWYQALKPDCKWFITAMPTLQLQITRRHRIYLTLLEGIRDSPTLIRVFSTLLVQKRLIYSIVSLGLLSPTRASGRRNPRRTIRNVWTVTFLITPSPFRLFVCMPSCLRH